MKTIALFLLAFGLCMLGKQQAFARLYYVNSHYGSDKNDGSSMKPLKTMARLNGFRFQPGDKILFSKGCTFSGLFLMKASGTPEKPIIIASYGIGEKPLLSNPDADSPSQNVILVSGNFIIIRNIRFGRAGDAYSNSNLSTVHPVSFTDRSAVLASAGVNAGSIAQLATASHLDVTGCAFYNCKIGMSLQGQHSRVTKNYFESQHASGLENDQEIAIVLSNSFAEILDNQCLNFKHETGVVGKQGGFLAVEADPLGSQVHDVQVLNNYLKVPEEQSQLKSKNAKKVHSLF